MRRINKSAQELSENQTRLILGRINLVEKYFGELCMGFSSFTRKTARVRDTTDDLSKILRNYSTSETINIGLSDGLLNLSKALTFLGDFRDIEVQRIEGKIISELAQYEMICRSAKDDLKTGNSLRDKEVVRKKQLDTIVRQRNLKDRKKLSGSENELSKSNIDVTRASKELENMIDNFEKRKLQDLKTIFLDFILIQLKMHTKSIEVLTAAYQDITEINEQRDMENFQKQCCITTNHDTSGEGYFMQRIRSQSMGALNSIFNVNSKRGNSSLNKSQTSLESSVQESPVFGKKVSTKNLNQKEFTTVSLKKGKTVQLETESEDDEDEEDDEEEDEDDDDDEEDDNELFDDKTKTKDSKIPLSTGKRYM